MSEKIEDQARLAQYNRLAEDWRHLSNLIWQMPSLAIALLTGIMGVSYQFLGPFPRALLLTVGAKHRLFHESTSVFMRELEDKLGPRNFVIPIMHRLSIQPHKMNEATKIIQNPTLKSPVEIHDR